MIIRELIDEFLSQNDPTNQKMVKLYAGCREHIARRLGVPTDAIKWVCSRGQMVERMVELGWQFTHGGVMTVLPRNRRPTRV